MQLALISRLLIAVVFCLSHDLSLADPQGAFDGHWLRSSINAYERVHVSRTGSAADLNDSAMFVGFLAGLLAAHAENNLKALIISADLVERRKTEKNIEVSHEIDNEIRIVLALAPLFTSEFKPNLPQVVAILRKYLDDNPGKWSMGAAALITNAITSAFPRK